MADVDVVVNGLKNIPYQMIQNELEGLYGRRVLQEFKDIIDYYNVYDKGADFVPAHVNDADFVPTMLKLKTAKILIDREARFMFASAPDITITVDKSDIDEDDEEAVGQIADIQTSMQDLVDKVLKDTKFKSKLLKAAKDCFIGKRVAYIVNFDQEIGKISISFIPSLGFVYDTDDSNTDILTKLIVFYATNDMTDKNEQRLYKKKYEMLNGKCKITEGIYNGLGELVSDEEEINTEFTYIPGGVILNDGLTGDMSGESDIAELIDFESITNKLNSADIDAERQNMNPILYAIDMDPNTTKGLSIAPGSFWDMASDDNKDGKQGELGTLEPKMEYSDSLGNTLDRIRATSFETLDIPDVSSKALQGVVSSGKTLKAIYWSLMVRCDEKFIAWETALEHIAKTIIDGSVFYPECAEYYINDKIPVVDFDVLAENNYPIQDDQTEEKEMDLQEVHNKVRSKKSYMKKYLGLTDKEVEEELRQMAYERQIEEESSSFMPRGGTTMQNGTSMQNQQNTPTFQQLLDMEQAQNAENENQ